MDTEYSVFFTFNTHNKTWNTQENMQHNASRVTHTFSLCLTCWWESEWMRCVDRGHFSLFLWSECVTGDLFLQFFGRRSLFCWILNIWSIRGPHPCSTLEKWLIHLDLSECIMVLRSCLLTARQSGSHKHSGPWSHYVIYPSLSLSSVTKSTTNSLRDKTNQIRQMTSREYMFACGKRFMCQTNLSVEAGKWIASGYYFGLGCLTHGCLGFLCLLQVIFYCNGCWKMWLRLKRKSSRNVCHCRTMTSALVWSSKWNITPVTFQ